MIQSTAEDAFSFSELRGSEDRINMFLFDFGGGWGWCDSQGALCGAFRRGGGRSRSNGVCFGRGNLGGVSGL